MLRDRNTVRMVADHWECSSDTVYRLIKSGELPCLRIGGVLRVSREQVEGYEACRTSSGGIPAASTYPGNEAALRFALETEQRRRFGSGASLRGCKKTSPTGTL